MTGSVFCVPHVLCTAFAQASQPREDAGRIAEKRKHTRSPASVRCSAHGGPSQVRAAWLRVRGKTERNHQSCERLSANRGWKLSNCLY